VGKALFLSTFQQTIQGRKGEKERGIQFRSKQKKPAEEKGAEKKKENP